MPALSLVVAIAAGCTGVRGRPVALLVAIAGLAVPWLAPPIPWLRGALALISFLVFARVVDLLREPPRDPELRIWHLVGVVDTRRVAADAAGVDGAALARIGGFGALAAVAWVALALAPAAWWLAGAALIYALAEVLLSAVRFSYRLAGARPPPLHDDPILARSLGEFWGRRWNRVVGDWLAEHGHRSLARAGYPALGVLLAFTWSAALHVHFALAGVGVAGAATMGAFFLVHGVLVLAERAARVERWPPLLGRLWTAGALFASLPLFVAPFVAMVPLP